MGWKLLNAKRSKIAKSSERNKKDTLKKLFTRRVTFEAKSSLKTCIELLFFGHVVQSIDS